jgi:hypothetical protein
MSADASEEGGGRERWHASPDEMERRRALAERVETGLSREEQETSVSFFGDADRYQTITYKPTMVRKLLRHDYARINWAFVWEGGEHGRRVSDLSEISLSEDDVRIEGVSVSLPLGVLSFKGSPRRRDAHSDIITTPDGAREVAATFDDAGEEGERE